MISTMFPGVAVELFYAVSLVLAAYGAGTSALRASGRKAGVISNLACGIVLLAAVGVFLPEKVVSVLMWPLVPLGVWYILPEIKKERKVFAVTTLLMLFTLGAALLPPYEWDEQVYQTALLRYYSESGFFSVKPDNPYSAYPSLPHSFLRYAFSGGGVTLPRLVIWLLSGIIAASFYVKFRDRSKKVTIAVLAAILLSPLSMILTRSFYAELYIVLFAFAGVEVLTEKEQNLQSSVLGGIMAAAACAVKLTGAGVAGALTVLLICRYRSTIFKVSYFIAAFFTALPFFLRVFLATGNPVYPYFSALFGNSPAACEITMRTLLALYDQCRTALKRSES